MALASPVCGGCRLVLLWEGLGVLECSRMQFDNTLCSRLYWSLRKLKLQAVHAAPLAADPSPDANTAAAPSTSAPAAPPPPAATVHVTATQASYSSREEEIAARIAASRLRRANRPPMLKCPACSIGVGTPQGLYQHLSACCPDLLQPASAAAEWKAALALDRAAAAQAVAPLLQRAAEQEQRLRDQVIHLTFRWGLESCCCVVGRTRGSAGASQERRWLTVRLFQAFHLLPCLSLSHCPLQVLSRPRARAHALLPSRVPHAAP